MSEKIFLSYRRADSQGFTQAIYNYLVQTFEKDKVFMDVNTLVAGTDFVDDLEKAVEDCDILLAVIGNQWEHIKDEKGERRLDDPKDFVRIEIAHALKRGIPVIPVLVNDAQMPSPDNLPEDLKLLSRRHAHKIGDQFNTDASRLIESIKTILKRRRRRVRHNPSILIVAFLLFLLFLISRYWNWQIPTPFSKPTETPTPKLICGSAVTTDAIPRIAPKLAGGTPFGVRAEINCDKKQPAKDYRVGLSFRSGSAFQWGISSPGVIDLSQYGVVSFWLMGNEGVDELVFGITDINGHFAKYPISASSEWVNVIIPLSDFQYKGVDLHEVSNIFMDYEGSGDATVYVDEITFVPMLTWEMRGANLTAFSHDGYLSPEAKVLVDHFKQIGANYVAVLVTGYQDGQQATDIKLDSNKTPSDNSLEEIIGYIHNQKMKVLLNLHVDDQHLDLDYPSTARWRGNFDPADIDQWFNSYRKFVIHYAQLAENNQVEIISIGSEQASLEAPRENIRHWIDIIRAVREEGYTGQLMYTMGRRSEADRQREGSLAELWKELDYVGTTAHFTLSEDITPSVESLAKAWNPYKEALGDWGNAIQKPIIFTEVAYRSVDYCANEPWRWRGALGSEQVGEGEKCQQNAYEGFLRTFGQEPWVAGAFWWNYIPGSSSDYSPENKPADNVVNRWYGGLPTETILRTPIPPVSTQVTYDLETPANKWMVPKSSSLTTTSATSKKRPGTDDWLLEWMISLAGKDENRKQGEALLDLRYNQVSKDSSTSTEEPFSYDMLGESVTCWVYVPEAPSGLTIQTFAKSLDDSDWWSEYGSSVSVKGNEWFMVTLKPDAISDTSDRSSSDDVDPEFDPTNVIAIGVRIMASDDIEYNGTLFIDACSWGER